VGDVFAGTILETDDGEYVYRYDARYLARAGAAPVSLTLPLRAEPYTAATLFPCFDGLIPEGWLLNLVAKNWKVDPGDRMALLLAACTDCVGAVSVVSDTAEGA
jgi:serine/threonine-protein kinase HipA